MSETIIYTSTGNGSIIAQKQIGNLSISFEIGRVSTEVTIPSEINETWIATMFDATAIDKMNDAFNNAFVAINTSGAT
jgi:hypothetical protein